MSAETVEVEVLLTKSEAEALTAKIKAYVGEAWRLLNQAKDQGAHRAMGYPSWAAYVVDQFNISRSYAYRLIAHAQIVMALDEAVGATPEVSPFGDTLTEGQTRHLNADDLAEEIAEVIAGLPAEATYEVRVGAVRDALTVRLTPPAPHAEERTDSAAPQEPNRLTGEDSPVEPIEAPEAANTAPQAPVVGGETTTVVAPPCASDEAPAPSSDAEPARNLRSIPTVGDDGPSAGDLVDWHPTAGQWSSYREFAVSDSAKSFALLMDRRMTRSEEEDMAGLCPPAMRKPAAFAARQQAAFWTELAAGLENPTRLSAVEA